LPILLGLDPASRHMSLPVLRALYKLVESGATVAGLKPSIDPSLSDDQAEFQKLSTQLFGDGSDDHTIKKGKVFSSQTVAETMAKISLAPNFNYTKPKTDTKLLFVHRSLPNANIYFVDNHSD